MDYLKELINGLPGDVLANLIAGAIATVLTLTLGIRGKSPEAERNIHVDQSSGQRIYAPGMIGNITAVDASQHHTTTSTVINKTTVNAQHYGNQASSEDPAGTLFLGSISAVLSVAVALFVTTLIPIFTWLPVVSAIPALLITAVILAMRRKSYTSRAQAKAIFVGFLTLLAAAQATIYMRASQDLANPYSLLSIYRSTDSAVLPTDGWGMEFIHRAGYLVLKGDRTPFFAWGIGLIVLVFLTLIYIYLLHMMLGSLLFPATSNGHTFGRFFTGLNSSFVTAGWKSFIILSILTFALPWAGSHEGITQLFEWGVAAQAQLHELITTF